MKILLMLGTGIIIFIFAYLIFTLIAFILLWLVGLLGVSNDFNVWALGSLLMLISWFIKN